MEAKYLETQDKVSGYVADFMNGIFEEDDETKVNAVTDDITKKMKEEFALTIEQEAMVKLTLFNIDITTTWLPEDDLQQKYVRMQTVIITRIVMGDWDALLGFTQH